ncbi:hypothetical protein GGTG_04746 [Gaeumannomyces tritici R3-111a-1]|uniref:Uncharacterized protein n=1 Tax=Gaeumannomyces tritici (strain R3-111a-1) TaxID=644352 RepID=J3NTZ7_GAET3|nr:hypothetical protein GGTG_04746 [Gaeumannomyces tritici R3-111a-1]EJT79662.1 hypothetical protein GGTG_04746 [Gaeumannomyces tritici R3-111a-1]
MRSAAFSGSFFHLTPPPSSSALARRGWRSSTVPSVVLEGARVAGEGWSWSGSLGYMS